MPTGRSKQESTPLWLKMRSSTSFIITTVAMGMFTDLFLWGVIVSFFLSFKQSLDIIKSLTTTALSYTQQQIPILPFIVQNRLHVPPKETESRISWLLSTNSLGAFLFSPIAGYIADRLTSRRTPFLFGLGALTLATILLETGRDVRVFILARLFQGVSGAIVWTVGLAICLETVGSRKLGLTMGMIWSVVSLGSQIAPVVGGTLYWYFDYEGVFVISVSLLALDLALRLLVLERKKTKHPIQGEVANRPDGEREMEETSPLIISNSSDRKGSYIIDASSSPFLAAVPIVGCLRHPGLLTSLFMTFVQAIVLSAFDATIPLIAIRIHHLDSFSTSLIFLALGIPEIPIGPSAGWLVDKYGTRFIATIAWSTLATGIVLLAFHISPTPNEGHGHQALAIFITLLTLCGMGITATVAPTLTEAGKIVERYYERNQELFGHAGPYALLFGINSLVFNAGFTAGPILAAYLKPVIGYSGVYLLLAGLCSLTATFSLLYLERN